MQANVENVQGIGDERAVDLFHKKCLRKILRTKWQDHVSTKEHLSVKILRPARIARKQNKVLAVICIEGSVRKIHFSRRNVTYLNLNSLP